MVYFLGAGLVVPASSIAYVAFTSAIILAVAVRCAARGNHVGYAKLALAVVFTASQPAAYFFLLLSVVLYRDRLILRRDRALRPIYLLVVYGLASYLINQAVEVNLLSYPFFLLSFFLPVIFFVLFRFEEIAAAREDVLEFFYLLLIAIALVMLVQTVVYWDASPDWRTGGTGHAHMAGILVAVGFVLALFKRLIGVAVSGRERFMLYAGLPLIFLADAKYVLALLLLSLVTMGAVWLFATKSRLLPVVLGGGAVVLILASWPRIMQKNLVLSVASIGEAALPVGDILDGFWLTPRGRILEETFELPKSDLRVFILGSGPGTFLSRAANSRAYDTMQKSVYDQVGGGREVESKLPGFIPPFTSWITRKYALDVVHWSTYDAATWQSGLVRWVSSLTSFFWEFGIMGFAILLFFYGRLLIAGIRCGTLQPSAAWVGYGLVTVALFMLGVSYFDLWMEMPQFAILHWAMLGLLSGGANA